MTAFRRQGFGDGFLGHQPMSDLVVFLPGQPGSDVIGVDQGNGHDQQSACRQVPFPSGFIGVSIHTLRDIEPKIK
jgi:hypothetical protein